jgi:PAS domain S-box-containing protein
MVAVLERFHAISREGEVASVASMDTSEPKAGFSAKYDAVARVVLAFAPITARRRAFRYASAPVAAVLAGLVQYAVFSELRIAPFVFLYVGIAACAGIAGRGPGLLCVLISAALGDWLFLEPSRAWSTDRAALTATGLFLVAGTLVSLVCSSFRTSLLRMEVAAREFAHRGELLRLAHDAILVWRPDGAIEFWNEGAERLYGFRPDETLGRISHDLLQTAFPVPLAEVEAALRSRRRWEGELTHRAKDGSVVIVSSTMQVVPSDGGRVLEANRDITDRRRAEQRLRALYELGLIGVLYWTIGGRIVEANDKFLEMTGYTRDDLRNGRIDWVEMTPPEWRHVDERAVADFKAKGISPPFEKEYLRKDGSRMPILIGGAMLDEFRTEGVAYVVDITDRKKAELALKESREALRLSDLRKSEFLGVLSHELRNPLAAIRSGLYVAGRVPPGSDQAARAQAVIERQITQLTRLTDDLLDLTRIAQGKIRLQPESIDFNELVVSTIDDHRPLFHNAGVGLEVVPAASALEVSADPTRVKQMVGNLLQNAAKFTPRGGRTVVSLSANDGLAELTVRDTGVGIDAEAQTRLFEPFSQSQRTLDRTTGGLGLGLALVKGLAEQHRGSVSVRSEGPGKGSTFVLRLPLERRRTPQLTLVPAARSVSGRRVLIVEDNVDAANMLREALELNGYLVDVAFNGPNGLEKARSFQPYLIVCDIGLPGMDGYQVARAVRADVGLRSVRLIALSGYGQPDDVEQAREAGFDLHLTKPVDLEKLEIEIFHMQSTAAS